MKPEIYYQLKGLIKIYKSCKNLSPDSKETLRYMQKLVLELDNCHD